MLEVNIVLQGRYQIVRPIGKGGMGAVYLAQDLRLGSQVALKETFFTDETLLKAFEREARLLASLRHAALPKVSDHFIEGEGQFLVMEYISGEDLSEMLGKRDSPFPAEEVLEWADQLLDALDYLHTRTPPVIHRDIKPQNLKLTDRDQIVLLDFGLAKGSAAGMTRASSYSIFGYTLSYAPLEQMQATGTDARSDLYSLAATLYHLLTAIAPPDAMRRANSVLNREEDPLRPASEVNPFVPDSVSSALARAMSLNRSERHPTAAEMRKALRRADSFNYVAGPDTEIIDQRATSSARPAAPTQANESDPRTQARSPQSEITLPETVVAAPVTLDHIAQKDAPARPRNWVATFNRKWAMTTVAVALIAGGATLAMLNFQQAGSMKEAPVSSPAPSPQPVQPDAASSDANSNTAVEDRYANEKAPDVRRESNANANAKARAAQSAEKPKAEPAESPKAQTPARRTGPIRRLRRMMTRRDGYKNN